eukprot:289637-Rhodomonas_salina.1
MRGAKSRCTRPSTSLSRATLGRVRSYQLPAYASTRTCPVLTQRSVLPLYQVAGGWGNASSSAGGPGAAACLLGTSCGTCGADAARATRDAERSGVVPGPAREGRGRCERRGCGAASEGGPGVPGV